MSEKMVFRVRFVESDNKNPTEVLARFVDASHYPGLICIADFVFRDQTKKIIMPDEESASKRFAKTRALHIPYHNVQMIEEVDDEEIDLKQLPFLRELPEDSAGPE